ncbi:hypothetical protein GCM10009579_62680 [Streptomyces javensis]|uniref:Uncharacterized protein n=1 Tax=Streptomyces javensis TaxID=114698 RepID=A0ABN1XA59_9ACTN
MDEGIGGVELCGMPGAAPITGLYGERCPGSGTEMSRACTCLSPLKVASRASHGLLYTKSDSCFQMRYCFGNIMRPWEE